MKRVSVFKFLAASLLITALYLPNAVMACDSAGPSTHIGQLMNLDNSNKTFTIMDAETRSPITFNTNDEIMGALKGYAGMLMVNYKESESGLTAIGVTF